MNFYPDQLDYEATARGEGLLLVRYKNHIYGEIEGELVVYPVMDWIAYVARSRLSESLMIELSKLGEEGSSFATSGLIARKDIPDEALINFATSGQRFHKYLLLNRPELPPSVLDILKRDPDDEIQKRLKKREFIFPLLVYKGV